MMDYRKHILRNPEEVANLCASFKPYDAIGLDVEGCEILDKYHPIGRARLFSVQFAVGDDTFYIPTHTIYHGNIAPMRAFLEDSTPQKVLHNAGYDFTVLMNEGVQPQGLLCDTLVAEYTAFNDKRYPDGTMVERGLKPLCERYFGYKLPTYEETFSDYTGKRRRQKIVQHLLDVQRTIGGEERIIDYAIKDPWLTLKLYRHVKARLDNQEWLAKSRKGKSMWDYYYEFERVFSDVLLRMEWAGMPLNKEKLWHIDTHYRAEQVRLQRVWEETLAQHGAPTNISHREDTVIEFLTKYVGLNLTKLTQSSGKENKRTGRVNDDKFALDKQVLENLKHPVANLLLEMRKVDGGLERYIPQLKQYYASHNGKCHSFFKRTGTRTGRLSSHDMNATNFPSRGELADYINEMFECSDDEELGEIDAEQIEVRIMAYMANDAATKKMILEELDQYIFTGSKVNPTIKAWFAGREPTKALCNEAKKLFPLERYMMKSVRLGYQYGMHINKTMSVLKCSKAEATQIYNEYWNLHSGIRRFSDQAEKQAKEEGFVLDMLGRRIWISGINFVHEDKRIQQAIRSKAARQAGNSRVQGTVSSLMMISMILIDRDPELRADRVRLLRQVHDSLTLGAPKGALGKNKEKIELYMSTPLLAYCGGVINFPTPAKLGTGQNVNQAKKAA